MDKSRLLQAIRQGAVDPFHCARYHGIFGGKGGSAPPPPDYTGAAVAQGQASREVTNMQNWANRPTQNTPWGTTSWNATAATDPASGQAVTQWTQNQTLNPQLQAALDDQLGLQAGRSDLAGSFMDRVESDFAQPFNYNTLPSAAGTPAVQETDPRNLRTNLPSYNLDRAAPQQLTTGNESITPTGQDTTRPDQTTFGTNEPAFAAERNRIEQGLFDRMRPEQAYQQEATRTRLANQGLTEGSAAYNRELQRLERNQAEERYNAMMTGGQEQQRLQQMLLGQQQQAFGQDLSAQQAQNQALGNLFGQQQAAGQFGLGAQQQAFGQDVAGQQARNQALMQQQQQQANAGNFFNQAQQNMFGQNQAANQQNFAQMMQAANYQNQLRQQAIAEQAQRRGMSLNEMNALLTGQQVGVPQMPSFTNASAAQPTNFLGAAQAAGNYGLGAAQMNQANSPDFGSLLGSGLMAAGMSGMF